MSGLSQLRDDYHDQIFSNILGQRRNRDGTPKVDGAGNSVYTIADGDSPSSVALAARVVANCARAICPNPPGPQRAGTLFTTYTLNFLREALTLLDAVIVGDWFLEMRPSLSVIAKFDQYEHLDELARLAAENEEIATTLGTDYLVTPDIVLGRRPLQDTAVNAAQQIVAPGDHVASHTPVRAANNRRPILLASVSCKWTMRSDRAQNTRTEAQNMIRNRKGQTPHIAAVTMEPLPGRLASIAMGLGDVDCAYHGALNELEQAAAQIGGTDEADLQRLIKSRRLRDISDLPFDLAG